MTSHWIGIAAGKHVAAGVEGGFAMFAHGRHEAVKRVLPDDWVTYYSPREGMDAGPADIYPLLDKFSFVTNRRHWGMYFRRSLFKVEENDFALVADATGVGNEFRNRAQI